MHYGTLNSGWSSSDTNQWRIIYCPEHEWFPSGDLAGFQAGECRAGQQVFSVTKPLLLVTSQQPTEDSGAQTVFTSFHMISLYWTTFGSSHHLVCEAWTQTSPGELLPSWETLY